MREIFTKIPIQEYKRLLRKARTFDHLKTIVFKEDVQEQANPTQAEILQWTKEARRLSKQGKLPVLHSLKDLR